MAPPPQQQTRAVQAMTQVSCPAVLLPVKEEEARGTGKRRWTDKLTRKIVEAVRPSRRAVATNKVEPRCDVDVETKRLQQALIRLRRLVTEVRKQQHYYCDVDVEKQRLRQEVAEIQARRRRSGAQALQNKKDVINPDVEPRKAIDKVIKPAVAATEESESLRTLVELLFPIGVLDKPPKICTSSGPRRRQSPSFQTTSLTAAAEKKSQGDGSSTPVDQRSEAEESTDHQATRPRSLRWSEQISQKDTKPNDDDGAPAAVSVNLDARPKKGILKVRPTVVAATPEEKESATPMLVELLFPVGFMSKPPQSFRSSGPENSLRRSRYLTEYCPFQRDDEESAPVQEETLLPPEPDRVEDVPPVKNGLPFHSPAAEAEFVEAIFSRHLLKDDFINRYAFKRSCERFAMEQSLQG